MSTVGKVRFASRYCVVFIEALIATSLVTDAMATPPPGPELYGLYSVNGTVFCQPNASVGKDGFYVATVGQIEFDPTGGINAGVASLSQAQVDGSSVDASIPFSMLVKQYEFSYSNNISMLSLDAINYRVVYGNIRNGIAGTISGIGVDSNGCARNFTMQLQPPSR